MYWRLGIDLGTNSLGWWAYRVSKKGARWVVTESIDGGVYIFPDGREPAKGGRVGESSAVERRLARGMRRNRDRGKTRMRALMRELVELGLMPADREARDRLFQSPTNAPDPDRHNPYRLRAEGLTRTLEPNELGRALFHLGLRRGFKSNRVEQSDDDGGNLKERIDKLHAALGNQTLGTFQWQQYQDEKARQSTGQKPSGIRFRGTQELYPDRAMYAAEFDAIREQQAPHHELRPEDWERLRDRYILFQWPLQPVDRGACEFFPDKPRHWRDTPIGHDFRIYQELNALRWFDGNQAEHPLSAEQHRAVLELLMTRKSEVKFAAIRKLKDKDKVPLFADCARFNLESDKRKGLKHHSIASRLMADALLSPLWAQRCSDEGDGGLLDDIVEALLEENEPNSLATRLDKGYGLDDKTIAALADMNLSRVTANVSRRFMEEIVPVMRDQGLVYADAVGELVGDDGEPLHHSHRPGAGDRGVLPYYGEILSGSLLGADPSADPEAVPEKHFGKINNPTVHVALNSLRRVVNALIERFDGPPVEVHVELSRDLKRTRKERNEISKRQGANERINIRIREDLKKHGIANPTALDVKKVKLWEELGEAGLARRCPFSGKPISFAQLWNGEAEIEHLLPFKRTLDGSMANLTVAMRWANRLKGNRTPHEAFSSSAFAADGIEWETVSGLSQKLPPNKAWRFGPGAMQRFEGENDFIARQLTDNAHIARAATRYMGCLKGVEQIVPNRGGLTALLRGKWRLNGILSDDNRKTREDHRHHAIDAAVIGLADRSVLKSVSDQTARGADDRVRIKVPELAPDIEQAIRSRVRDIIVAFKPDHGWQGAMFKETAYGFVAPEARDPDLPEHNLVVRKPLLSLTAKEHPCIRDRSVRRAVQDCVATATAKGKKVEVALARFSAEHRIGSVRILIKDQTVDPVPSADYKGYKPNSYVCCDIWRCPKGKSGEWKPGEYEWRGVFWSHAQTPTGVPAAADCKPHPAAKLITRLYKNDMVAYDETGLTKIMRVAGFSTTNNKLDVVPHAASNPPQNYVSINVLGRNGLKKLSISPMGRAKGLQS
jgi:CRISPR-associated endonuclease Csn1